MTEIWKPIKGFEERYEVSNLGCIRSVSKMITYRNGAKRFWKGQALKQYPDKDGYLKVVLAREGKQFNKCVHRLVAEAFLENPNHLPMVNHKDECKSNNQVENLEWCTAQYNCLYSNVPQKMTETTKVAVLQMTRNFEVIKQWESMSEAGRELGISFKHISRCVRGERPTAGGYRWLRA